MTELLVAVIFSVPVPIYLRHPGGLHKGEGGLLAQEHHRMAATSPSCSRPCEPSPADAENGLMGSVVWSCKALMGRRMEWLWLAQGWKSGCCRFIAVPQAPCCLLASVAPALPNTARLHNPPAH